MEKILEITFFILLLWGFVSVMIYKIKEDYRKEEAIAEWQEKLKKDGKQYIPGFGIHSNDGEHLRFNTEE